MISGDWAAQSFDFSPFDLGVQTGEIFRQTGGSFSDYLEIPNDGVGSFLIPFKAILGQPFGIAPNFVERF